MSKQFRFYATKSDLIGGFDRVSKLVDLLYVDAWLHENPKIPVFADLSTWQELGENASGKSAGAGFFLVVKTTEPLKMKTVKMDSGGSKFKFEPLLNPSSIVIQPSGVYKESDPQLLIAGMCGTALNNPDSTNLYSQFRKAFLRGFNKQSDGSFIGPDATSRLSEGEFDLK